MPGKKRSRQTPYTTRRSARQSTRADSQASAAIANSVHTTVVGTGDTNPTTSSAAGPSTNTSSIDPATPVSSLTLEQLLHIIGNQSVPTHNEYPISTGLPRASPASNQFSLPMANIIGNRYLYLQDLLTLDGFRDPSPPALWSKCPSPILVPNWRKFLASHPDQTFAAYIWSGLTHGFRIGCDRNAVNLRSTQRNHPSALEHASVVSERIISELNIGRLIGPIHHSLLSAVHISPIGLVPKKGQSNQWRMIVDLSFPLCRSVNDGIPKTLCSLSYASVDDAVEHIIYLGRNTELIKVDLKDAYRIIPIHPDDSYLLAISWNGLTFVDRALPFGLRSAPKIFTAVSDMIAWALYQEGLVYQIHYLDDFLFLGRPGTNEGEALLSKALEVFAYLGVPVAPLKIEGPATTLTFLGIDIDTHTFELRLPQTKMHCLRELLQLWVSKRSCTRKELESFLGHLSHAATVVRPGRTFLRQLFGLLQVARVPHHFICITASARADIHWWNCFINKWNGSSFFPLPMPSVHVYTDASTSFGCGAFVQSVGWFSLQWPSSCAGAGISSLELVPVVIAAALWGEHWSGQHVCFHSDNTGVVSVLKSRTAETPFQMHLLRCFSLYCGIFHFTYSVMHVPGARNSAADALSRNDINLFSFLVPQTPHSAVPQATFDLLVQSRPEWGSQSWTNLFSRSLAEVLPRQHCLHTSQERCDT